MNSFKNEDPWRPFDDLVLSPLCAIGALLVLVLLGAAEPIPFWLWWVWIGTSSSACFAVLATESPRWRLLCFAIGLAFVPLSGDLGCLARALLPVAGARFVSRWPRKIEHAGLDAICLWPFVGAWLYREGLGGLEIDVISMLLIVAVAVAGISRSAHAPKIERRFGRILCSLVILAAACAATARPWAWAVAIVFGVIALLLSVPIVESLRRGRRTKTAGAAALAASALLAGAFLL